MAATTKHADADFDLQHDDQGRLVLIDGQSQRHTSVEPVRGFPISDPEHWISICDVEGRELVSVKDLAVLSPPVRKSLEQELARREFIPLIHRVIGSPAETEPTEWEVETDRGQTRFLLNSADDVRRLGPHRALVIDAQGIRYVIEDMRQLDTPSRRTLERYL